ncbi:helix-turn-helix transcriptional regulator [Streptomyces sp. M2CJ-2]|uniref:helix-turn-helix transcriptional regulator n=1 Tax=Streptomyces sp. M2CJ-2 TaxID=2803948 RepID=UPI001924E55B|nr:helix-turn-helix transcriptional regulator [Streptomyces sp. M2CJ-2]MBL3664576.1 helix-turn-helix transcriptional regulator [Streptomyces sp. M2CJ-2]
MPADQPEWVLAARRATGDRIRVRRLHQNMTQESLAHAAGVDRSTVQRMEAGAEMKLSHLLLVAHALRVHVTDLLHG